MKAIVGSTAITRATYRDSDGTLTDPGAVVAWVKKPDQSIAEITTIINPSTGIYDVAVPLDSAGIWYLEVTASGEINDVLERTICVVKSSVA